MATSISNPEANSRQTEADSLLFRGRSEEVQEIMGRMPGWITRYGTLLIGFVLLLCLIGAWFISYPDKVPVKVHLISNNPPVIIHAEQGGRIKQLFVQQNSRVRKGDSLLILDNQALYQDLVALQQILRLRLSRRDFLQPLPPLNWKLGHLQQSYAELVTLMEEASYFLGEQQSNSGIRHLETQLTENDRMVHQLQQNKELIQENLSIDKNLYENDLFLFQEKVMSESEYLQSRKKWLDQQINIQSYQNQLVHTRMNQVELKKGIEEIKRSRQHDLADYRRKIALAMQGFIQKIALWEKENILRSPIDGTVNLFSIWKENQYLKAGQSILVIIPAYQQVIAKAELPLYRSGRVAVNNPIHISLDSHPSQEFGYIEGKLSFLSTVPLDSVYSCDIVLPNGLQTSTGKTLFQLPEMFGTGEILTEEKNVLQRLFDQIKPG